MDITFSSFQIPFRNGIHRYARASGIDVVFLGIGGMDRTVSDDLTRSSIFDLIVPSDFDGILAISTTLTNEASIAHLAERLSALRGLPLVSIGTSVIGEDSLVIDSRAGIRSIMDHLIGFHGYRSFAYVSGPPGNNESRARLSAFRESLSDAGIAQGDEWVYDGNFTFASGSAAVRELLDVRGLKPDAFVCANDNMALGAYEALTDRGLRIPFDVAVTGCDDIHLEQTVSHGITTVHQSFSRLSWLALERLHRLATGKPVDANPVVAPSLRIRHSCGCLRFRSRLRDPARPAASGNLRSADTASPADTVASADAYAPGIAANGALIARENDATRLAELARAALDGAAPDGDVPSGAAPSGARPSAIERAWVDAIRDGMARGRPTYEFEEILHSLRDRLSGTGGDAELDVLVGDLYAILCEECGQQALIVSKKDQIVTRRLRALVDRLHDGVSRNLEISGHAEDLREIAALLGVRRLYIVRFGDYGVTGSEPASIVFAGGTDIASSPAIADTWKPGPGSWFPPDAGNLAANLVHYENNRFGYFVIDSDIPVPGVYEFLRFRFGFISMNLFNLGRIKRLNAELTDQIAIRVGAEQRLKDALSLVERLSIKDELTGINNRRGFFMFAEQSIVYFRRQGIPFFVLYADMDGLKEINDRWGHNEGDVALRHAASSFQEAIRGSDVIGRVGGDEFTMLVGTANQQEFDAIRGRILEAFARKNREIGKPWTLSVSVGHYYSAGDETLTLDEMLALADHDLYRDKARKKTAR